MNRNAFSLLTYVLMFGAAVCAPSGPAPAAEQPAPGTPPAAGSSTTADPVATKAVWDKHCKLCHGAEGVASRGMQKLTPNLDDAKWQASRTDKQIRDSIVNGKEGTLMKSYRDRLSDEEIDALVAYIRAFRADKPAE